MDETQVWFASRSSSQEREAPQRYHPTSSQEREAPQRYHPTSSLTPSSPTGCSLNIVIVLQILKNCRNFARILCKPVCWMLSVFLYEMSVLFSFPAFKTYDLCECMLCFSHSQFDVCLSISWFLQPQWRYWKCNFPILWPLLSYCWLVGWLVGRSVGHNYLDGREVTLLVYFITLADRVNKTQPNAFDCSQFRTKVVKQLIS